jgi:hypothetical protein
MARWAVISWLLLGATARGDSESLRRARDLSLRREPDRILASQRANLFNDSPRAGAMVSGAGVNGRFDLSGRHVYLSDGRVGTVYGNMVQYSDGSSGWVNGNFISVPERKTEVPQNAATKQQRTFAPPRICVTVDGSECVQPLPVVMVPAPALPVVFVPTPTESTDDEPRPADTRR